MREHRSIRTSSATGAEVTAHPPGHACRLGGWHRTRTLRITSALAIPAPVASASGLDGLQHRALRL
jgi:hypothetical protein